MFCNLLTIFFTFWHFPDLHIDFFQNSEANNESSSLK